MLFDHSALQCLYPLSVNMKQKSDQRDFSFDFPALLFSQTTSVEMSLIYAYIQECIYKVSLLFFFVLPYFGALHSIVKINRRDYLNLDLSKINKGAILL